MDSDYDGRTVEAIDSVINIVKVLEIMRISWREVKRVLSSLADLQLTI